MIIDKIRDFYTFSVDIFDGKYGWWSEALMLLTFLLIVNVFLRTILKKLHARYHKAGKIWRDSFVKALFIPLSSVTWFVVLTDSVDVFTLRMSGHNFFNEHMLHMATKIAAILAIGWFLYRWKENIITLMFSQSKSHKIAMEPGKIDIISKVITIAIVFVVAILLMEVTDSSMSILLAFGGMGGLAFAFASQKIIANIFSGFMIYITRPFAVGDWIQIPERNIEGVVEEIGWYMTRIRTFCKSPVYVPNSIFSEIIIQTPSRMSHQQIKEKLGIRYCDIGILKTIVSDIKSMIKTHPDIDPTQRICVNFVSFGSYSLDIMIDAYTYAIDFLEFTRVKEDILFKIAGIIAKNGAQLALPTSISIRMNEEQEVKK